MQPTRKGELTETDLIGRRVTWGNGPNATIAVIHAVGYDAQGFYLLVEPVEGLAATASAPGTLLPWICNGRVRLV